MHGATMKVNNAYCLGRFRPSVVWYGALLAELILTKFHVVGDTKDIVNLIRQSSCVRLLARPNLNFVYIPLYPLQYWKKGANASLSMPKPTFRHHNSFSCSKGFL